MGLKFEWHRMIRFYSVRHSELFVCASSPPLVLGRKMMMGIVVEWMEDGSRRSSSCREGIPRYQSTTGAAIRAAAALQLAWNCNRPTKRTRYVTVSIPPPSAGQSPTPISWLTARARALNSPPAAVDGPKEKRRRPLIESMSVCLLLLIPFPFSVACLLLSRIRPERERERGSPVRLLLRRHVNSRPTSRRWWACDFFFFSLSFFLSFSVPCSIDRPFRWCDARLSTERDSGPFACWLRFHLISSYRRLFLSSSFPFPSCIYLYFFSLQHSSSSPGLHGCRAAFSRSRQTSIVCLYPLLSYNINCIAMATIMMTFFCCWRRQCHE